MVAIGSLPSGRSGVGVHGCGGMHVCCWAGWVWQGPPGVVAMSEGVDVGGGLLAMVWSRIQRRAGKSTSKQATHI